MAKEIIKVEDLVNLKRPVDVTETKQIMVRGLSLQEMLNFFVEAADVFLPLYNMGLQGIHNAEALTPFLLSSPELVAKIIATASDSPDQADVIQKYMPGTVQLMALLETWKASVPDPKKAHELLSEVTALLQKRLGKESDNPSTEPLISKS